MVDARGGAMRGCRHSGVRVIIPPRKAPMPMRVTCRSVLLNDNDEGKGIIFSVKVSEEGQAYPPTTLDGGRSNCQPDPRAWSSWSQVPWAGHHRGSPLCLLEGEGERDRDPAIWQRRELEGTHSRSNGGGRPGSSSGQLWWRRWATFSSLLNFSPQWSNQEAQIVTSPNVLFTEATQLEDLNTNRITRILTTDFPQYFAIITRIRQEVHAIGPEGGVVNSTVVPQVQAVFPQGALTKKIKVGLQVNMFRPRKAALANGLFKKITVNHVPKKKRFSLIWWGTLREEDTTFYWVLNVMFLPCFGRKVGNA